MIQEKFFFCNSKLASDRGIAGEKLANEELTLGTESFRHSVWEVEDR